MGIKTPRSQGSRGEGASLTVPFTSPSQIPQSWLLIMDSICMWSSPWSSKRMEPALGRAWSSLADLGRLRPLPQLHPLGLQAGGCMWQPRSFPGGRAAWARSLYMTPLTTDPWHELGKDRVSRAQPAQSLRVCDGPVRIPVHEGVQHQIANRKHQDRQRGRHCRRKGETLFSNDKRPRIFILHWDQQIMYLPSLQKCTFLGPRDGDPRS